MHGFEGAMCAAWCYDASVKPIPGLLRVRYVNLSIRLYFYAIRLYFRFPPPFQNLLMREEGCMVGFNLVGVALKNSPPWYGSSLKLACVTSLVRVALLCYMDTSC